MCVCRVSLKLVIVGVPFVKGFPLFRFVCFDYKVMFDIIACKTYLCALQYDRPDINNCS